MSNNPAAEGVGLSGTTWGVHLNRSNISNSNFGGSYKTKAKIKIKARHPATISDSFSNKPKLSSSFADKRLTGHVDISETSTSKPGPRSNLKKRKNGLSFNRSKSSNFFDTLGLADDSLSQDSFSGTSSSFHEGNRKLGSLEISNELGKKTKSDPLLKFDPEISMDGFRNSDLSVFDSSEPASVMDTSTSRTPASSMKASRPLSFLGAINSGSSNIVTSISNNLSFQGMSSVACASIKPTNTCYENGSSSDHQVDEQYKTPNTDRQIKRLREELTDATYNSEIVDSRGLKRFCGADQAAISFEEIQAEEVASTSLSMSAELKVDGGARMEGAQKDILDKQNWSTVENRLALRNLTGKENEGKADVYRLGFEEEDDVGSAKIAAAAGRTALLPLHDAGNTADSGIQNIKKERLMQKLVSGRANENYQKINLKKKVFVRGRVGRMTGGKYLRQEWKRKMIEKQKNEVKKNVKAKSDQTETKNTELSENNVQVETVSAEHGLIVEKTRKSKKLMKSNSQISTGVDIGDPSVSTKNPRKAKDKRRTVTDDSFIAGELEEDGSPVVKKTKKKITKLGSCKLKNKVMKDGKPNGIKRKYKDKLDVTSIDANDSDIERDVWGNDIDDSVLLRCFDETGVAKTQLENESTDQICHISTKGIGCKVEPYYSSEAPYDTNKVHDVLRNKFGHFKFRSGQEEAIRRILYGKSTLVQLATGSGKSLVYQLPAYLYGEKQHCITLVVSPLVSLMEDQINGLPGFLRAACFHSGQTLRQREKVLEQIKAAASNHSNKNLRLHFLLVSPETLAGGGSLFGSVLRHLPPIAFVCVDEAHCVSAWSHNFRPTYLRLCRVVREKLGVTTLLGLTASAPEATIRDVAERLSVCAKEGVVRGKLLPPNLKLSVSRGESQGRGKEGDLIALLASEPFVNYSSIIVYCTRRDTCDKLATIIRTHFQDRDVRINKTNKQGQKSRATSLVSEPYHAGMSAYKRKTVQTYFMSGKLRIVVATVAFGMGIDKSDIRAVIHYNMPSSFESYVQEIGRSGRDGKPARCHLFLDSEGRDLSELKRHIYGNSVDRHTIRKLLQITFMDSYQDLSLKLTPGLEAVESKSLPMSEKTKDITTRQNFHSTEVAVPMRPLVEKLDMPEENISTFMCYLEEHEKAWLRLLNPTYSICKLHCYGGRTQLEALSKSNPVVAAAMKYATILQRKVPGHPKSALGTGVSACGSTIEFPVIKVASDNGWDSGVVKRELKNLQWTTFEGPHQNVKRSAVLVEFSELGFHFESKSCLTESDLDEMQSYLYDRALAREKAELESLKGLFNAFRRASFLAGQLPQEESEEADEDLSKQFSKIDASTVNELVIKSDKLKAYIKEYFERPVSAVEAAFSDRVKQGVNLAASNSDSFVKIDSNLESQLRAEVRQFVVTHSDHTWTGRAVARIFHGIQSPNFPAKQWGRVRRYWRAHLDVDFNAICKLATQEVVRLRSGKR